MNKAPSGARRVSKRREFAPPSPSLGRMRPGQRAYHLEAPRTCRALRRHPPATGRAAHTREDFPVLQHLIDAAFEIVSGEPHHLTHAVRVHFEHYRLRLAW